MNRYTVTFSADSGLPSAAQVKDDLGRMLARNSTTGYHIADISLGIGNQMHVAMTCDMGIKPFKEAMGRAAAQLSLKLETIEWGWPDNVAIPPDAIFVDRYAAVRADMETEYQVNLGGLSVVLASIIVWLVACLMSSSIDTSQLPILNFLVFMLFVVVVVSVVTEPRYVVCGATGLKVGYWLLPSRTLDWGKVCSFRIISPRMIPYGISIFCGWRAITPIIFQIGSFPKPDTDTHTERDILVKAIITRAALRFVDGSPWGSATYRRAEVN